jgi:hypothetical protein
VAATVHCTSERWWLWWCLWWWCDWCRVINTQVAAAQSVKSEKYPNPVVESPFHNCLPRVDCKLPCCKCERNAHSCSHQRQRQQVNACNTPQHAQGYGMQQAACKAAAAASASRSSRPRGIRNVALRTGSRVGFRNLCCACACSLRRLSIHVCNCD